MSPSTHRLVNAIRREERMTRRGPQAAVIEAPPLSSLNRLLLLAKILTR